MQPAAHSGTSLKLWERTLLAPTRRMSSESKPMAVKWEAGDGGVPEGTI